MDRDEIASTLHYFQLILLNSDDDGVVNGGDARNSLPMDKTNPINTHAHCFGIQPQGEY